MADESNQLRVRLVTPERVLFEAHGRRGRAAGEEWLHGSAVRRRAAVGGAGRGRRDGAWRHRTRRGGESRYNVSWGFVEVLPDRVTILASDALKPEEIDVPRAQEATGARPQGVERSRRQRRGVRRGAARDRRSRSQTGYGGGEALEDPHAQTKRRRPCSREQGLLAFIGVSTRLH